MTDKMPMVLKKKKKLDEEITIAPTVDRGSVDIDNPQVRSDINNALKTICIGCCVTPYIPLEKARKILANYSIDLPKTPYLHGPSGSHVFPVNQFGNRAGMNDKGEFTQKNESAYSVHFTYHANERGSFEASVVLAVGADRPEEKPGSHPHNPNTMPRMNGPETGKKPIDGQPGINEGLISNIKNRITGRRKEVVKKIEKQKSNHLDDLAHKNRNRSTNASILASRDPDPVQRKSLRKKSKDLKTTADRQHLTSTSMFLDPESSLKRMSKYMTGKGKSKTPAAPEPEKDLDDRVVDIKMKQFEKKYAALKRPTTAPIRTFNGKTLAPANMNEGLITKIKRAVDKVSGNKQKRVVGIINKKMDARQIKTLGHLTRGVKDGNEKIKDLRKLGDDKRYRDLNKRYMRASDPESFRNDLKDTDFLKNNYLKGKGKKMNEDKDAEDNKTWKNRRAIQKHLRGRGEEWAKQARETEPHDHRTRNTFNYMSDDDFAISDKHGAKADAALPGAKRDFDKRLSAAVAKAKAKKIMQEEFKKGDKVKVKAGPHQDTTHEVIHVHEDGSCNVRPIGLSPKNTKYRLGAAKAKPSDLVKIDEAAKSQKPDTEKVTQQLATRMQKSINTGKNAPAPKIKPSSKGAIDKAVKDAVELHGAQRRTDAAQKDDVKARAQKRVEWKKNQEGISKDRIKSLVARHLQHEKDMAALANPAPARQPQGIFNRIKAKLSGPK